jgi:N,N'-diacetyllegionaminate synthase
MNRVIVIAEAGVNHNGSIDIAVDLIKAAAKSGADYVKFQTFITELNISKSAKKANYQEKNTEIVESQFEFNL